MSGPLVKLQSRAEAGELGSARLGTRSGRLDQASQLAVLAVEKLGVNFEEWRRERVGICLAARFGSLATDADYWQGRDAVGGPSPLLFAYTLPSAAVGEIAMRWKLTGPNLCLVGQTLDALAEAEDMVRRGEVDACICVGLEVLGAVAADWMRAEVVARAEAYLVASESGYDA